MLKSFESFRRKQLLRAKSFVTEPLIINSFGRSGSTLLYTAARDSALKPRHAKRPDNPGIGGAAWRLKGATLENGRVYKTHARAVDALPAGSRMIYIFGDPAMSTLSVINRSRRYPDWLERHCEHLGVDLFDPEELFESDVLGLENHVRGWLASPATPTAFVRYEALWDHVDDLSDFMGFTLHLPKRRERSTDNSKITPAMEKTYAAATELINGLPDWQVRA